MTQKVLEKRKRISFFKRTVSLSFCLSCLGSIIYSASASGAEGIAPPAMYPANSWQGWSKAVVRIMNRLDSHREVLTLPIGEEGHYRSLTVKVLSCLQRPVTLSPETAVQLKLEDSQNNKELAPFEGWMFARQPGLSVYPSSLYDVQIVKCEGEKVNPMVGSLPSSKVPQIIVSSTDTDSGEQSVEGASRNNVKSSTSAGAPTSLLPSDEHMPPSGSSLPSPEETLPPPTSLLP